MDGLAGEAGEGGGGACDRVEPRPLPTWRQPQWYHEL